MGLFRRQDLGANRANDSNVSIQVCCVAKSSRQGRGRQWQKRQFAISSRHEESSGHRRRL